MNNSSKILIFIFISLLISSFLFSKKKSSTPPKFKENEIIVEKNSLGEATRKQISYLIHFSNCHLKWTFTQNSKHGTYSLEMKNVNTRICKVSFEDQIVQYKKLLNRAFLDWDKDKLENLSTGSFATLDPSLSWNKIFVEAAMENQLLKDYKKKYPDHSSQLSINELFIRIANEGKVYNDFKLLFESLGLNIELEHCEKVFNGNRGKISEFGVHLNRFGSMIYDAGILHFKVKHI